MWTHSHRTAEQEWKEEPKCCARMVSNRREIMLAVKVFMLSCPDHMRTTGHIVEVELNFMLFSRRRRMYILFLNWSDECMRLGVRVPRIKFTAFSSHIRSLTWLSMRKIDGPDPFSHCFVLIWALSHSLCFKLAFPCRYASKLDFLISIKRGILNQFSMQESAILTGNA